MLGTFEPVIIENVYPELGCGRYPVGSYESVEASGDLLAYAREEDGRRFIIVLNLGAEPTTFDPGATEPEGASCSRPTSTARVKRRRVRSNCAATRVSSSHRTNSRDFPRPTVRTLVLAGLSARSALAGSACQHFSAFRLVLEVLRDR